MDELEKVHVIEAHSEMTGGNCYTYWGKFSNDRYFVWFNETFSILDEDYGITFTDKFFEETGDDTYNWENTHTIKTIETKYMWHFVEEALNLIKN